MMVFMVKGLLHKFDYPYVQFACGKMLGDLIFDPIWEAIARLERIGFFVIALCCNSASSNRRLWKLHSETKELVYRIPNIFASDGKRYLYFISDPPHLIKTIRNSWYNKNRRLWIRYCAYCSYDLLSVCCAMEKGLTGNTYYKKRFHMCLVPKLKFEYIKLTSYSKMRVDLAAQVCILSQLCLI